MLIGFYLPSNRLNFCLSNGHFVYQSTKSYFSKPQLGMVAYMNVACYIQTANTHVLNQYLYISLHVA